MVSIITEADEETSLAMELFENNETKNAFENYELLRNKNEIWSDSYMESPLSKCFSKEING